MCPYSGHFQVTSNYQNICIYIHIIRIVSSKLQFESRRLPFQVLELEYKCRNSRRSESHKSFTLSGCIGFPNSPQLCSMVNKHRITQNMIALEHLKNPNRHGSSKRPQTKPQKGESKTRHWSIWEIQDMQGTHVRNSKHPIYNKACAKCNSPRYSTTSFNTKFSCYQD